MSLVFWLTIVAAGLLTFAIRFSFIIFSERLKPPSWFQRGLRFVPVAVLSALILPDLVTRNGAADYSWHNPQLFAGLFAVLVAWRTKNVLLTIVLGMAALLVLGLILH